MPSAKVDNIDMINRDPNMMNNHVQVIFFLENFLMVGFFTFTSKRSCLMMC